MAMRQRAAWEARMLRSMLLLAVFPSVGLTLLSVSVAAEPMTKAPALAFPAQSHVIQAPQTCTCRAQGADYQVGALVCLSTPNGSSMARCEMVLNNTSWTFLNAPCPQS